MFTIHMFSDGRIQLADHRLSAPQTRFVALESLVDVFRQQSMGSPVLPPGCLQYWRGYEHSVFVLQKPEHRREMNLQNTSYMIPVPDTLFVFRIQQEPEKPPSLTESVVLAMSGPWQGEHTTLYEFPFGNIFSDRTICWGDFDVELPNFHHLDVLTDIFLGTPFNTDLSGNYYSPGPDEQDLTCFWAEMEEHKAFPTERLIRAFCYNELVEQLGDSIFY